MYMYVPVSVYVCTYVTTLHAVSIYTYMYMYFGTLCNCIYCTRTCTTCMYTYLLWYCLYTYMYKDVYVYCCTLVLFAHVLYMHTNIMVMHECPCESNTHSFLCVHRWMHMPVQLSTCMYTDCALVLFVHCISTCRCTCTWCTFILVHVCIQTVPKYLQRTYTRKCWFTCIYIHICMYTFTSLFRGDSLVLQSGNVCASAWMDRRVVLLMSTGCNPLTAGTVQRKEKDG